MNFEKTTALLETDETPKLDLEDRVVLDTIYYNIRDLTSAQLVKYFSKNPRDAEKMRDYIQLAIDSDYPRQRTDFLMHISQTYLD